MSIIKNIEYLVEFLKETDVTSFHNSTHDWLGTLVRGDCLLVMALLRLEVDMIFADLPYGTTKVSWDHPISFDKLWTQFNRLIKHKRAMVFTSTQPFTTDLISSNRSGFKYELVWNKLRGNEPQMANKRPMKAHENIVIFGYGELLYNPQMTILEKPDKRKARGTGINRRDGKGQSILSGSINTQATEYKARYPISILPFENGNQRKKVNPTQKPIELLEYLIKTYTNPGDIVLDPVMGSGTTCEACLNTGRRFIGIEQDVDKDGNSLGYYDYAVNRIKANMENIKNVTSIERI